MIGDDFASVVDGCGSGTLRLKKSNLQHKTPRSAHWIDLQGFCSGSGQQDVFWGREAGGERFSSTTRGYRLAGLALGLVDGGFR
jgi:hypothetical protein